MTHEQLYLLDSAEEVVDYVLGDDVDEIPSEALDDRTEPLDGATGDLDALKEALNDVVDDHESEDPVMEKEAAVAIHEHLDITRRHAAHPELWHWLAITQFPEFVRHRWSIDGAIEEKFLGAGKDVYSNAIYRLWIFAEMTSDADDYTRTRTLLSEGNQFLANRIFDRSFGRVEPMVKAVVDVLAEHDTDTVKAVTQTLRNRETNYRIETMSRDELEPLVQSLVDECRAASPDGSVNDD